MNDERLQAEDQRQRRVEWTIRLAITAVAVVVLAIVLSIVTYSIVHHDPHCAGVGSLRPGQSVSITCPEHLP